MDVLQALAESAYRFVHDYAGLAVVLIVLAHFSASFYVNQGVRLLGVRGYYLSFGLVGTVLHELSHLLTAVFFLHRIGRVQLLTLDPHARVRGFVEHGPRTLNPWSMLGVPIISTAPVLVAAGLMTLLAYLSFRGTGFSYQEAARLISTYPFDPDAWMHYVSTWGQGLMALSSDPRPWLFLLGAMVLGAMAQLSGADWRNAAFGVVTLLLVYGLISGLLPSFPGLAEHFLWTRWVQHALFLFNQALILFVVINTAMGLLFLSLRLIRALVRRMFRPAPMPAPASPDRSFVSNV